MKKLIFVFALFFVTNAYADTAVTYETLVSPSDVTVDRLDRNFATFVDFANAIDGGNIQSGTVSADALTNNANPEKRWADSFIGR